MAHSVFENPFQLLDTYEAALDSSIDELNAISDENQEEVRKGVATVALNARSAWSEFIALQVDMEAPNVRVLIDLLERSLAAIPEEIHSLPGNHQDIPRRLREFQDQLP